MNRRILTLTCLIALAGCAAPAPQQTPPAIDVSDYDTAVRPQDDFWAFTNGKWVERTEIPADQARWGAFVMLREKSREDVKAIITELAQATELAPGTAGQKIRDLYNSFMDEEGINQRGAQPIAAELERIDGLADKQALATYFAHAAHLRVERPLSLRVNQDQIKTDEYIVYMSQSGLGLPDRDYYFDEGDKADNIRAKYVEYAAKMFDLAGIDGAAERAQRVYDVEKALAEHHWTRVENRDRVKTYNKMPAADVRALAPSFAWDRFLEGAGFAEQPEFVVRQPSYLKAFDQVFKKTDLDTWKDYMRLRVIDDAAPYLSEPFVQAHFDFYDRTLQGREEQEERWKRGVNVVSFTLGELVGQEYVKRHFPPEAKARMQELVGNLKLAMGESIDNLAWMTDATKQEARAKLAKFGTKIGYPDEWRDYSKLEIAPDDLIGNLERAARFEYQRALDKLGGPIDRGEWFMSPQTVNAYYNPLLNEVVFPAAILQPPFFYLDADDAVNYGAIGVVIGHEIGHGFDDQGRRSDGNGVLRDWWTEDDAKEYTARTDRLVEQYEQFSPFEDLHVNGRLTLGENIGDLGGMTVAWRAYQKSLEGKPQPESIDGYTGEQRFFLSYAQIWRNKTRPDYLRQQIKTDPHSPPEYRVLGPLPNFDPFYAAFDVQEGDGMYMAPEERVQIW